jgi:hypothetical protein
LLPALQPRSRLRSVRVDLVGALPRLSWVSSYFLVPMESLNIPSRQRVDGGAPFQASIEEVQKP